MSIPPDAIRASRYLFIFLFCLFVLSFSSALTARNSGEGFMKVAELENLLRTGSLGASPAYKWGAPGRGGLRYDWHQFGQQALVLPLYLFTRLEGYAYYLVNAAATAFTAVFMLRILRVLGFGLGASLWPAVAFGAGSLAWYYAAKTPHEHAVAIAFILAAVYWTVRYRQGHGRHFLVLAAASVGAGFTVRYDVILALIPVALYLLLGGREERRNQFSPLGAVVAVCVVLLPFVLMNQGVNFIKFGSFFETGHAGGSPHIKKHWGLEFIPRGIIGALVSPGRSIFLYSPVLLLFPLGVAAFRRRVERPFFWLSIAFIVLYSLFYAMHHSWDGDWCFGPRYFLVLGPFMLMAAAPLFESFAKLSTLRRTLIAGVLVVGVLIQIVFVGSNSYLSNVMKFGIDDDGLPELSRRYTRDFGVHGSWEWLWGYFPLKYAQFFNQLEVFRYTVLLNVSPDNEDRVARDIRASDAPFLLVYFNFLREFDLWWLQTRSRPYRAWAVVPAATGTAALALLVLAVRRTED